MRSEPIRPGHPHYNSLMGGLQVLVWRGSEVIAQFFGPAAKWEAAEYISNCNFARNEQ